MEVELFNDVNEFIGTILVPMEVHPENSPFIIQWEGKYYTGSNEKYYQTRLINLEGSEFHGADGGSSTGMYNH